MQKNVDTDKLKELIYSKFANYQQFIGACKMKGYSPSLASVKSWFNKSDNALRSPSVKYLPIIAEVLGANIDDLLNLNIGNLISFNYYPDIAASAGYGLINTESKPEVLKVSDEFAKKVLHIDNGKQFDLIRVKGNSMSPLISSGDFVVIDRGVTLLEQVKNGDVIIFRKDDELYCKYLKKDLDDTLYMLSENNEYKELKIEKFNDFIIIGKVITKLSIETFETMLEVVKV